MKRLVSSRRKKIFLARQTEQDRDVVLKFMAFPKEIPWEEASDKFQREVIELQKFEHPNLVKLYGAGVHEQQIFFAFEWVNGESLAAVLSRRGKITPDLVVEYGRQIANLLAKLHEFGLVHAKLTPAKILVTRDHQVRVAGLRYNRPNRRRWDSIVRRELDLAAYLAPEQFTEGANEKSDLYAVGVILYEMLTGKLPYPPASLARLAKTKMTEPPPSVASQVMDCPVWLDNIVSKLLNPDPKARPHSAQALAYTFEEIKNVDANQRGAVSQIAGNFNPLTAGVDKSKASQLLEKSKPNPRRRSPFFQSIPFLIGSLIVVLGMILWALVPPSTEAMIERAQQQIASDVPANWREASSAMKRVFEAGGTGSEQAKAVYYLARRKILVDVAKRNAVNIVLQTQETQDFIAAYQAEINEDFAAAKSGYLKVVQAISPTDEQVFIRDEAIARYQSLAEPFQLPSDKNSLLALVEQARRAQSLQQWEIARRLLGRICIDTAGEAELEEVFTAASEQLAIVDQKLAEEKDLPGKSAGANEK